MRRTQDPQLRRALAPRREPCGETGCRTILCSYNPSDRCWIHGGWVLETTKHEQVEALGDLMAGVR